MDDQVHSLGNSRQLMKELTFFGRYAVNRNGTRLITDVRIDDWAAQHYEQCARIFYRNEREHHEWVDLGGES